ncbi:MAG: hypothetical protein Kow0037_14440 [Calditrichia bacterium]
MIVRGEAVIYYGHARLTGDIDIYYENRPENVDKLFQALLEFWEGDIPGIQNKDELLTEGQIVQFGVPPNRIDLLNYIDGITFTNAWQNKIAEHLRAGQDAILIYYIGLRDLILNNKKDRAAKGFGRPEIFDQVGTVN